jgi:hypothetical protein
MQQDAHEFLNELLNTVADVLQGAENNNNESVYCLIFYFECYILVFLNSATIQCFLWLICNYL